jgi:hypothetical protein
MWMAAAVHAGPAEEALFVPDLDLFTTPTVQFDVHGLTRATHYRLTGGIVPVNANDAPFGLGLNGASRALPAVERHKDIAWTSTSNTGLFNSDRTSLAVQLRLESKGERLELIPRRHSVWILWRKELH